MLLVVASKVQFKFELGLTAPQHCIGYRAPFRKKPFGSTDIKIWGMDPTT